MTKQNQDIPEAPGIPLTARGKKHGAHSSPGAVFSKPLGIKRRFPAQGAAQSFSPSVGTEHVAWGLSSRRDHSESPQGSRDNADGTAPQMPRAAPTPGPQQRADGASPLTPPSLLGPGKGGNSDPSPASSWGAQERQHSLRSGGRGAQPASPKSGLIPNGVHLSEPNPRSQESPPGSSSLGLHPQHRDAVGGHTGLFLKSRRCRTQRAELAEGK